MKAVIVAMLRKGDVILILLVVFGVSLITITNSSNNPRSHWTWDSSANHDVYAIIKKDDRLIKKINLSDLQNREVIKVSGQIIAAEQNKICFLLADCSDRLCINSGWLSKPGQIAVCFPTRTLIKIVSESNSME